MCLLEKDIKYTVRMCVINFIKNVLCNGENGRKWKEMKRGTSYALLNLRQWGNFCI